MKCYPIRVIAPIILGTVIGCAGTVLSGDKAEPIGLSAMGALKAAVSEGPGARQALAGLAAGRAAYRLASALKGPTLGFEGSTSGGSEGRFTVNAELDLAGKEFERAGLEWTLVQAESREGLSRSWVSVARKYVECVKAREALALSESRLNGSAAVRLAEVKARVGLGKALAREVLEAEAFVGRTELEVLRCKEEFSSAMSGLCGSVGLRGGEAVLDRNKAPGVGEFTVTWSAWMIQSLSSGLVPDGISVEDPGVMKARASLGLAELALSEAGKGVWPSLGMTATYGSVSVKVVPMGGRLSGSVSFAGFQDTGWRVGVEAAGSIYDGGAAKARVEMARKRMEACEAIHGFAKENARQALVTCISEIRLAEASVKLAKVTVGVKSEALRVAKVLGAEGLMGKVGLADAEYALLEAESMERLAEWDLFAALAVFAASGIPGLGVV